MHSKGPEFQHSCMHTFLSNTMNKNYIGSIIYKQFNIITINHIC